MQALGLRPPSSPVPAGAPVAAAAPSGPPAKVINIGGFLRMGNAADALQQDTERTNTQLYQEQQNQPVIAGLAAHIKAFWVTARAARQVVEMEMLEALLARRGQYTPEKLQQIQEQGQTPIYMMVASAKMRQIESLLRDVLLGSGAEKPWTIKPSPVPDLPPQAVAAAVQQLTAEIEQALMSGFQPTIEAAQQRMREIRDELAPIVMEEARRRCERMEQKMEDQLLEGGFIQALDEFITDLATYKTAFIAGPVVRNKPKLTWAEDGAMVVETTLTLEWERVDPFDVYPAPWARKISEGPLIRKHRLTRQDLNEMIGVEGYSEAAIREVLKQYDQRGFREWLSVDSQKAIAEGKEYGQTLDTGLIDALQYWGSASGSMLQLWGMPKDQVPDPQKEYQVEAWLIGPHVIKAVLNADPLARRPLYGTSFQKVPGSVWGNAPYDLMRDCQDICNGAARSLVANMGIASGPQAYIISNRLPAGEDVTEMYPWKIWQFESDPMGAVAKPMEFFQPTSNAVELMAVFEKYSLLADEYTGVPRYMAGFNGGEGGAGRTASGISMMISNASKIIKHVVGNVDIGVTMEALPRLHYYNMRYGTDPELKGDINLVPLGALSLVAKESAQVRTNEFLQMTANPIDMQIMGIPGRAELLRNAVKRLDLANADKVVPPLPVLQQRMAQAAQAQMQLGMAGGAPGQPGQQPNPGGGEQLQDGSPTTDHFAPKRQGASA